MHGRLAAAARCLRLLRAADDGNAVVEMALVSSLLVLLISGAACLGMIIFQVMQVDNAVEAGVAYAVHNNVSAANFSTTKANIEPIVQHAAGLTVTVPDPDGFWGCATPTGITSCSSGSSPCSATCASSSGSCSATCNSTSTCVSATSGTTCSSPSSTCSCSSAGYYVSVSARYSLLGNSLLSLRNFVLSGPQTVLPDPVTLKTTVRVQ